MNDYDICSVDFTRSLPPPLKDDPEINALGRAIAEQLQITAKQIRQNIIYARIDELDEQTLDILAYDLHVDWYDHSYPIEVKRQTIKDSVKIHRRLGTKYAVETALGAVFPGTKVEEWFEYGGDPYTFRVIINATENGVTAAQQAAVLERVIFYKNLRSHLEAVRFKMEKKTTVHVGGIHSIGTRLEVWPYLAENIETSGTILVGGALTLARRLEIRPFLTRNMTAEARSLIGGYTQYARRLEIRPKLVESVAANGKTLIGAYTQGAQRIEVEPFVINHLTAGAGVLTGAYTRHLWKLEIQPFRKEG
ncbi:phage tail protein I [Oscillibacter sp. 1-3]|uniref:phage tail protein I n=1 Tax=Oscillibacter sp. 1-3 TaxID=1235797 RepID=UPI00033DA318|nr:phage tail protein I [Oscillibacter sp. 1-3]EOS64586.1 phage tail protein I [Oscillibacter sp. 1-3]